MNKHYLKGRRYEYLTMRKLEQEGYLSVRSSGSHSPGDVIGFLTNPLTIEVPIIRFIQVKATKKKISKKEKEKLKWLPLPKIVSKEI